MKTYNLKPYNLIPRYDGRKSFYGKAMVIERGDEIILVSYDTEVAYIKDSQPYVRDAYSHTTLRHIKEFLKQHGFKAESKYQILRDYI